MENSKNDLIQSDIGALDLLCRKVRLHQIFPDEAVQKISSFADGVSDKQDIRKLQEAYICVWTHFRADALRSSLVIGSPAFVRKVLMPQAAKLMMIHPQLCESLYQKIAKTIASDPTEVHGDDDYDQFNQMIRNLSPEMAEVLIIKSFESQSDIRLCTYATVPLWILAHPQTASLIDQQLRLNGPRDYVEVMYFYAAIPFLIKQLPEKTSQYVQMLAHFLIEPQLNNSASYIEAYHTLLEVRGQMNNPEPADFLIKKVLKQNAFSLKRTDKASSGELSADSDRTSLYIGRRVMKTLWNRYGWQKRARISPTDVCVLLLGGGLTVTDAIANGYLSHVDDLLKDEQLRWRVKMYAPVYHYGDKAQHPDFSRFLREMSKKSQMYEYGHRLDIGMNTVDPTLLPGEVTDPQFVHQLFETVFLNRLCDSDGKRLPLDETMRRMRNITVIAHCFGGFVFLKTEELIRQKMKELGFTKAEETAVLKQLFCVLHAPSCPLNGIKSSYVAFASVKDTWVSHYNHFQNEVVRIAEKDGISLSFFPARNGGLFLTPSQSSDQVDKDPKIDPEHFFFGYVWEQDHMSFDGKTLMQFGHTIVTNALLSALDHRPLPELTELISDPQNQYRVSFGETIQNGSCLYEKIVRQARLRARQR